GVDGRREVVPGGEYSTPTCRDRLIAPGKARPVEPDDERREPRPSLPDHIAIGLELRHRADPRVVLLDGGGDVALPTVAHEKHVGHGSRAGPDALPYGIA